MAAPTPSAIPTPSGIKLKDGYRCFVTIATAPTIGLWTKSATPPGVDGGEPVDQTTMHNDDWVTRAFQQLLDLKESTFKAAYDPAVYTTMVSAANVETTITYHFSDGSTLCFYGGVRMFDFDEMVRGTQPTCTVTFTPTNFDNVNKVEAAPVLTSVEGT